MTTPTEDLSLYEAARDMGVIFTAEVAPTDREVRVNGIRLHYLDWRNEAKPPMLLLHGRANSAHTWDFTALAFYNDYHVIALDQRGHGDSDWSPNGDYSLNSQLPDIEAFVESVALRPIYLIGHSMGGRTSLVYAAKHPERVRALVIVDMAPETQGMRRGPTVIASWRHLPRETDTFDQFVQEAYQLNPRRSLDQHRRSLSRQLRQYPNGKWGLKWDPLLRNADSNGWSAERLWECAAQLRCPTLLIRGGESGMVSDAMAQRMAECVPNMKAVVVAEAGHNVPTDSPAHFQLEVRQFLATLP